MCRCACVYVCVHVDMCMHVCRCAYVHVHVWMCGTGYLWVEDMGSLGTGLREAYMNLIYEPNTILLVYYEFFKEK